MSKSKYQYQIAVKEYASDGVYLNWCCAVTRYSQTAKNWLRRGYYVTAIHDDDWGEEGVFEITPNDLAYGFKCSLDKDNKIQYEKKGYFVT